VIAYGDIAMAAAEDRHLEAGAQAIPGAGRIDDDDLPALAQQPFREAAGGVALAAARLAENPDVAIQCLVGDRRALRRQRCNFAHLSILRSLTRSGGGQVVE